MPFLLPELLCGEAATGKVAAVDGDVKIPVKSSVITLPCAPAAASCSKVYNMRKPGSKPAMPKR